MTLRNFFRAVACIALLGLSACPSSCERGCNQMDYCANKLNGDRANVAQCVQDCGKTDCVNLDEVYGCYADMKCVNGDSYLGELWTCTAL